MMSKPYGRSAHLLHSQDVSDAVIAAINENTALSLWHGQTWNLESNLRNTFGEAILPQIRRDAIHLLERRGFSFPYGREALDQSSSFVTLGELVTTISRIFRS